MTELLSVVAYALGALLGLWMVWVQILVHECAHAVALWLLGGRVNSISVGAGRFVWSRSLFGCRLELRPLWRHGMVQGGFERPSGVRWRWILFYLAGPIASTAVAVAFWLVLTRTGLGIDGPPWRVGEATFVRIATWVTTFAAVTAWLPMQVRIGRLELASDIRALGQALRWDRETMRANAEGTMLARRVHLAWDAFLAGHAELALQRLADAPYPEDQAYLRDLEAAVFTWIVEGPAAALALHQQSHDAFATAEIDDKHRRHLELNYLVNRLFFLAQDGSAEALAAGDAVARELGSRHVDDPAVQRTLGVFWLHAGSLKHGMRLLRNAWRREEPAWLRALCATYLAYGHAFSGSAQQARRFLRKAHRLHPQCAALPRYRALVAAAVGT